MGALCIWRPAGLRCWTRPATCWGIAASTQTSPSRQELEARLRQAEKMEALGTLTGGIAHDFNNILAAMIGFAELVKEKLPKGSRDERHLQMVMDAGLRGRELIRQMLTFSRKQNRRRNLCS